VRRGRHAPSSHRENRLGVLMAPTFHPHQNSYPYSNPVVTGTEPFCTSSHEGSSLSEVPNTLERAKAGDPQAFQELVRPHVDAIRRFARSFCKNDTDADDLAQDALVKAYRSFGAFDGRSSLTTWLYTIAKNQFLDHRRGRLFRWRSRESELSDFDPSNLPNAEQLVDERQKVDLLWAALRRIDEKFRTPLVLAEIDGLAYEQIAEVEGIPIGTVRSRIARAKDQLRNLLDRKSDPASAPHGGTSSAKASSYPMAKGVR
jgi:RNA polymerase sigma-70 factor, ECF subfamily